MRTGINLLFLKPGLAGGTETYSYGLLKGLAETASTENTFFIFCSYNLNLDFLNDKPNFLLIKYNIGKSVAFRCFFEQFIFPFRLKKYKLDVLHSLGYIGPVTQKNHLVTIHDANAFAHTDMQWIKRIFLSFLMRLTAKMCTHIIAVSIFSKKEIIKHLHVAEQKITVIYEACKFARTGYNFDTTNKFDFLNNAQFFVGLSSTYKNKNIITLINAFKIISQQYPQLKLVLVGHLPIDNSIQKKIKTYNLANSIFVTGYVEEKELISIFRKSIAFVFPSVYEGFGLPLLEAQNLGVPVISSNKGSLPEIGGDSVLYFDALDEKELAEKMITIYTNKELYKNFIEKGFINASRFSWNITAKQVLELYNDLNG